MSTFDNYLWNAKTYRTDREIFDALERFHICGKTVKDISVIGCAGNMLKDELERKARQIACASGVPLDDLFDGKYPYFDRTLIPCTVDAYEPTVILFTDGSTFEFQPIDGAFKMSVNMLQADMHDGLNHQNFHPSSMYAEFIGQTVKYVKLLHTDCRESRRTGQGDIRKDISLEIHTTGDFGIKATQENCRGLCRYSLSLMLENQSSLHDKNTARKTLFEMLQYLKPISQILMLRDASNGGCFFIAPVKRKKEDEYEGETKSGVSIYIDEYDLYSCLEAYLEKYFDVSYNKGLWHNGAGILSKQFEGYASNDYTYDALRMMIAEIRADIVKNKDILDGVKIDFYNRFCECMEKMMDASPEYCLITFSGP